MDSKVSPSIEQETQKGIQILKTGGIIAFPTDTVYGLGADATNERAVAKIYELKQRPYHFPLPLLLADVTQITSIAEAVPDIVWLLARYFLPGALTLVLPRKPGVCDKATAQGSTVAVRIPNHPIPLALIHGLGLPLVGTSANLTGRPSAVTAGEVYDQLGDKVNLIIDGGRCTRGIESTVVDATKDIPIVLREGAIPKEEFQRIYQEIVTKQGCLLLS